MGGAVKGGKVKAKGRRRMEETGKGKRPENKQGE